MILIQPAQHGLWPWSLENKGITRNIGFEVKQTYVQITVLITFWLCALRPVTNLFEFVSFQ